MLWLPRCSNVLRKRDEQRLFDLLFNEAVGSSEKITSTAGMISEQWTEKDAEGIDRRLI